MAESKKAVVSDIVDTAIPVKKQKPAPVAKKKLCVCKGKAITSKKGILSDEMEVDPLWFQGGAKTVKELLKKGVLVES